MPIYSRHVLGLPPDEMGLLMAISGIGSFAGSLGLLTLQRGHRALALKIAAAITAIAGALLGIAQTFAISAVALVMMTLGAATSFGIANTVIQERAPDPIRGRVSAVASLAFFGILPFSGMVMSALSDAIGLRAALIGAAGSFAILAAVLLHGRKHLAPAPQGMTKET